MGFARTTQTVAKTIAHRGHGHLCRARIGGGLAAERLPLELGHRPDREPAHAPVEYLAARFGYPDGR
jgi:hypothetical protein